MKSGVKQRHSSFAYVHIEYQCACRHAVEF